LSINDLAGFFYFGTIISCVVIGYINSPVLAQSGIPIETEPDNSSDYSAFAVFIFIVIIIAVIWKLTHRTKNRRYFPDDVKREVLKDQNYKCAICKRSAGVWDYDHIDGNRSNNDISNCQALCPNCHAKKTRGLLEQEKSSKRGIIIAIVIIMVFLAMVAIIL
jgi:HNH endonuclease